jgi:ketosteroid isomerase-like protein
MSTFNIFPRAWFLHRRVLAAVFAVGMAAPVHAVDFGTLRLYAPPGQAPYAEIMLSDNTPLDPADIRARIATRDAYGVAGMRYQPALQQISITPQGGPNGQVVLRLERLPDPATSPEVDLLLLVGDRMSLSLGEYRVNLTSGNREFAAAPAGARLAGSPPPTSNVATAAPVMSGTANSVPTAPMSAQRGASISAAPMAQTPQQQQQPQQQQRSGASASLAEARAAIDAWARAWSQRNVDAYVAAYTPDFSGRGGRSMSRNAWVEQRRDRIMSKQSISVEIDRPELVARGDKVVATFTQRYRGDNLSETSRKRLELVRGANGWLIAQEEELQ